MVDQISFDAVDDSDGGAGIDKVGGAYGNGACTSNEKFDSIFGLKDASHTDDGQIGFLGRIVNELDGNGFDGGSAQTAASIG